MPTPQGRRPPPPQGEGLVYHWSIIRLSKGDDRALLGLWGGEAEEAGHSEVSGVKGEVERSEIDRWRFTAIQYFLVFCEESLLWSEP